MAALGSFQATAAALLDEGPLAYSSHGGGGGGEELEAVGWTAGESEGLWIDGCGLLLEAKLSRLRDKSLNSIEWLGKAGES